MGSAVRVIVADDNLEVLMATADLISELGDVEVVSLASNVEEAVACAATHQPDIAFVDGWLRGGGAAAAVSLIKAVSPRTLVVGLASARDVELVMRLRAAGAVGCFDKESLSAELPQILASVPRG